MSDSIKMELREISGSPAPTGGVSECTVTVETEAVQPRVEEGIKLVIEIVNRGAEAIELINPLDFLAVGILLFDQTGQRVELPSVTPRLLIHTGGPYRDRLSLPFNLSFVEVDGRRLSDSEVMDLVVRLAPGGHLRSGVALRQVLPRNSTVAPAGRAPEPVPPGRYQIEISVTLATSTDAEIARIVQSPSSIEVSLGPPGAAGGGVRTDGAS